MKRSAFCVQRQRCILALLFLVLFALFLFSCGNDVPVTPPNHGGESTTAPGGSGDGGDNAPGSSDGTVPGQDDGTDPGIPKKDTDPDGGNYGNLERF